MKLVSTSPTPMQLAEGWLDSLGASTMKLGLGRMTLLLKALGNPEEGLPVVHIAGTNGKGSVLAMLAGILKSAGYKTGCYTSPHLLHVRERIAVDGSPILPDDFSACAELVKLASETLPDDERPTYFEALNAMAFVHFKKLFAVGELDIVLLETGLGGRLDSTNVVKHPNVCVITGIDFDHMEHLGDTLAKIAAEKAGIIKPGTPVVVGPDLPEEALAVIRDVAQQGDSPLMVADAGVLKVSGRSNPVEGLLVEDAEKQHGYRMVLMAPYQVKNLATVLAVVAQLREQDFKITEAAIAEGLAQTRWPGRFQYFAKQRILLDVSHNAQGFEALAEALSFYFADKPMYWLASLRNNREPQLLMQLLARFGKQTQGVIFTAADNGMIYHPPQVLADAARVQAGNFKVVSATEDALHGLEQLQQQLKANPDAIGVISGSIYTAGKLLQRLS